MMRVVPISLSLVSWLSMIQRPQEPETTYELRFKHRLSEGQKIEIVQDESETRTLTVREKGELPRSTTTVVSHSVVAVCEILKWDIRKEAESRWTFSKDQQMSGGKVVSYGVQGKSIRVLLKPGAGSEYSCEDGSRLIEADRTEMNEIIENAFNWDPVSARAKSKSDKESVLNPAKPIRVGESWKPDVKEVIEVVLGRDSGIAFDWSKSESQFTLKSVTSRRGADFARVEGSFTFVIMGYGPMKFDLGLPVKAFLAYEGSLDGRSVDNEFKFTLECKGTTPVKSPGKVDMTVDVDLKNEIRHARQGRQ